MWWEYDGDGADGDDVGGRWLSRRVSQAEKRGQRESSTTTATSSSSSPTLSLSSSFPAGPSPLNPRHASMSAPASACSASRPAVGSTAPLAVWLSQFRLDGLTCVSVPARRSCLASHTSVARLEDPTVPARFVSQPGERPHSALRWLCLDAVGSWTDVACGCSNDAQCFRLCSTWSLPGPCVVVLLLLGACRVCVGAHGSRAVCCAGASSCTARCSNCRTMPVGPELLYVHLLPGVVLSRVDGATRRLGRLCEAYREARLGLVGSLPAPYALSGTSIAHCFLPHPVLISGTAMRCQASLCGASLLSRVLCDAWC